MALTLTAAIGYADGVLPVSATFPNSIPGLAQIDAEQISIVANGSTSWTAVRGVNGTTASAHASSAVITPLFEDTLATVPPATVRVGQVETKWNTVARTDTAAKTLFTLPVGAVLLGMSVSSPAVSNAATTATLSVGQSGGTGAEYLSAYDVKGATGAGQQRPVGPTASLIGAAALTTAVTVTGTYAETGTASSAGGPWTVVMEYAIQAAG